MQTQEYQIIETGSKVITDNQWDFLEASYVKFYNKKIVTLRYNRRTAMNVPNGTNQIYSSGSFTSAYIPPYPVRAVYDKFQLQIMDTGIINTINTTGSAINNQTPNFTVTYIVHNANV